MRNLSHRNTNISKTADPSTWKLIYNRFKPNEESLREVLCTLGNGYRGTRGAALESPATRIHYPGTYGAGIYNKLGTHIAGRTIFNEDFVNCPNWLLLTFKIGKGEWIIPSTSKILSYYQELDMHSGVLSRRIRLRDHKGHIMLIESTVIVHMAHPHLAAIKYSIVPENFSGSITVRSGLDGSVQNTGVTRYRQLNSKHLTPYSIGAFGNNGIYVSVKTNESDIYISEASCLSIVSEGQEVKQIRRAIHRDRKRIFQEYTIQVNKNKSYEIEKICSIYTSKDKSIPNHLTAAIGSVKRAPGFLTLLKTHQQAWKNLWKKFDIEIKGDEFTQKVIRLHIFHLLQTASPHNTSIDAGLPARGLHGEAYRGHIFWDELFVMPFFDFHMPKISKALLLYRYRRIQKARLYAKRNSYRGAMFPWQSSSTGEEETQVVHLNPLSGEWGPDYSHIQRHISFAIAFNVWKHWERTEDFDFLIRYAAEMLLSIAQFSASLTVFDPHDGRYHTEGVMGPDEFHEKLPGSSRPGLKDNAYSNIMIVWTLRKARETLALLPGHHRMRIIKKLGLDASEFKRWDAITRKMNIIINEHGIISQFDGYFDLKEIDLDAYRKKYRAIERMDRILKAEGKSPNEYKVVKQADVLMTFYVLSLEEIKEIFIRLGYTFDKEILNKNYDYYVQRTSHGSTLSKVVHCYLAHLLGRSHEAWEWFMEVLKSDIYDTQGGTTPEGIHCGVMGGSITIVMNACAGIKLMKDRIRIEPKLPGRIQQIKLKFYYRKNWIFVTVTKTSVAVFIQGNPSKKYKIPFEISHKLHHFSFGKEYIIYQS